PASGAAVVAAQMPEDAVATVIKPPKPADAGPTVIKPPTPPDAGPTVIKPPTPSIQLPIIPNLALGLVGMNPLIAVAAAVLPDVLKAVLSDKSGTVAGDVTQAVAQITQTQSPEEARNKLNADPAAVPPRPPQATGTA